jgi:hypothetical protein
MKNLIIMVKVFNHGENFGLSFIAYYHIKCDYL